MSDVRGGPGKNTILLVECSDLDIPWTEPRNLDFPQLSFLFNDPKRPGPSSWHSAGVSTLFADGHVETLRRILHQRNSKPCSRLMAKTTPATR